ncbi:MAG: hypothetical protein R2939_08415 [Kofleriaceae bacterium]
MGRDADGSELVRYEREEASRCSPRCSLSSRASFAINVELKVDVPRWWGVEVATEVARDRRGR